MTLLLVGVLLIFVGVLLLYRMPLEAVLYAALLSLVFIFIVAVRDFMKQEQLKNALEHCLCSVPFFIIELPVLRNDINQRFFTLIEKIQEVRREFISSTDMKMTETVDYYTMWVHQIKTPIQAMRLLLQSDHPDLDELSNQLFRIEEYVGMVLHYLRVDQFSNDLVLKKQSLDPLIKQAVRKYAKFFIHKKITLDFQKTQTEIVTDEKWFVFVLEQLLSNCLKYTQQGKVTIKMEQDTLLIQDTGIGISPQDLPRLGEKGFTGYNGHADKKSTGIGLYLCRKICQRLSHPLTIDSTLNEGTTVRINIKSYSLKPE